MSNEGLRPDEVREAVRLHLRALDLPTHKRATFIHGHASSTRVARKVILMLHPEPEPEPEFPEGLRDLGYEPLGILGCGITGPTFQARHKRLHIVVAVKVRLPGMKTLRMMIENERTALLRLRHPNIARIIDGGELAKVGEFVVTEFIEGTPLADPSRLRTLLQWDDLLSWFERLTRAIHAAHAKEIFHNDLHAWNVLVTHSPDGLDVQVIDFGMATVDGIGPTDKRQQRSDQKSPVGDIRQIGVLLRDAVIKPSSRDRTRFDGTQIAIGGKSWPLSRRLALVVGRTLATDRLDRYDSAGELADDLLRIRVGDFPARYRPSLRERAVRLWQKDRRIAGMAAALLAMSLFSAILLGGLIVKDRVAHAREAAMLADAIDLQDVMRTHLSIENYFDDTEQELPSSLVDTVERLGPRLQALCGSKPDLHLILAIDFFDVLDRTRRVSAARSVAIGAVNAWEEIARGLTSEDLNVQQESRRIVEDMTMWLSAQSPPSPTE